jgi:MoxR-like ATPase
MQLIGNSRDLIRDAVRRLNPDLSGRKVNDLRKDELLATAAQLGIDVAAIVASVTSGTAPAPHPYYRVARDGGTTVETTDPINALLDEDAGDADGDDGDGDADETDTVSIETEANNLRRELGQAMVEGNFDAITTRLTTLLTEAHKPPVVQYVNVPASADGTVPAAPIAPATVARVETWGNLFGVKGNMAGKKINVFTPHPTTPAVDPKYRWPDQVTQAALCAMIRARNVWLYGPAGTGKTSFAEQLAARTGRPFFLIPCDDTTEAPELVGMTVPCKDGVRWQDGVLTAAMRVPHAIVLIDEPTVARAGAIMVLQSVLQSRVLSIKETGELVRAPDSVRFLVADNTNGTGGGNAEGYEGTRRMNRATLDRFASFLRVTYMEPKDEAAALVAHTGCSRELAKMLVECAGLTRKAKVTHALGLRRLIAWAEALTDGIEPRSAFEFTILNSCARDDREPTEQCCALGLDKQAVEAAITGRKPDVTPTPAAPAPMSRAAADFSE